MNEYIVARFRHNRIEMSNDIYYVIAENKKEAIEKTEGYAFDEEHGSHGEDNHRGFQSMEIYKEEKEYTIENLQIDRLNDDIEEKNKIKVHGDKISYYIMEVFYGNGDNIEHYDIPEVQSIGKFEFMKYMPGW